ncbi:MAG TPA: hypothetical protein VNX70_12225 [Bryobacteraceae bacterium]|jgi:hypothetical protein|nr:hypothetical protein [Bryobacteraceae bacterium]
MNRNDFQQLAENHLRHAKALLDAELYSGAYYICGYAVECALRKSSRRRVCMTACSTYNVHWKNVEDWSDDSRYDRRVQKDAQDLYSAVSDPVHVVLACIKRYW